MTEDEILDRAAAIAASILDGAVSAHVGAAQIWVLSAENNQACFAGLRRFIAAASQWDELPQHRYELIEDIRRAAVDFLQERSVGG